MLVWVNLGRKRILDSGKHLSFKDTLPVVLLIKFRDFLFHRNFQNAHIYIFFSSFHNFLTNATYCFLPQAHTYSEDGKTLITLIVSKYYAKWIQAANFYQMEVYIHNGLDLTQNEIVFIKKKKKNPMNYYNILHLLKRLFFLLEMVYVKTECYFTVLCNCLKEHFSVSVSGG